MSMRQSNGNKDMVRMMVRYMAWANEVMMNSVAKLPDAEIIKPRCALFGTIAHTLNHIFVVDDIFRAHLEGRQHGYKARNTETSPSFSEVRHRLGEADLYYVELAERLSAEELAETIDFEFVGGGAGAMRRQDILLHLVNHATYHRGFVSDMMYQIPFTASANDLSVFLRDIWPSLQVDPQLT